MSYFCSRRKNLSCFFKRQFPSWAWQWLDQQIALSEITNQRGIGRVVQPNKSICIHFLPRLPCADVLNTNIFHIDQIIHSTILFPLYYNLKAIFKQFHDIFSQNNWLFQSVSTWSRCGSKLAKIDQSCKSTNALQWGYNVGLFWQSLCILVFGKCIW